jgi:hydroxymethylbilane synthase
MKPQQPIRIGTRGSALALIQANDVRDRLLAAYDDLEDSDVEIRVISTSGDRIRDKPLKEFGGKGLFTKEIEDALLSGDIDLAVHSMKDVPTVLPTGLLITCLLPREDPLDAFLSPGATDLANLPNGAVVGSSSLRRIAQIRHARPDLEIVTFRGNVDTRLRKLDAGEVAATFLACAGLNRMGLSARITRSMPADIMLPAVAQGAVGVETRAGDDAVNARLAALHDSDTADCVAAERAMLAALDGSCRTPIAGLALLREGELWLRAEIIRPDGSESLKTERRGPRGDAGRMGRDAGEELRSRAGPGFFEED